MFASVGRFFFPPPQEIGRVSPPLVEGWIGSDPTSKLPKNKKKPKKTWIPCSEVSAAFATIRLFFQLVIVQGYLFPLSRFEETSIFSQPRRLHHSSIPFPPF